jgi:hypothetical protein
VVLRVAAVRIPALQGAVPLLIIALAMGFSLPNVAALLQSPIPAQLVQGLAVPGDGISAARWLRDHSDPNDLVATNIHCRVPRSAACDSRQFWVSAYSERRVLVEGWDYAGHTFIPWDPFWDQALLATNDAAFEEPSTATVAALRNGYGVRWLFADATLADPAAIGRYADLRYRAGDFAVFEAPPG